MKVYHLLLLTGLLFTRFSWGQFDPNQFDKKLLEHEIKVLIDSTRLANHLKPLYNDSILYVAADYHAGYLLKKKALSHDEPEYPLYKNPQQRALTFGAPSSYYVGENIVFTPFNANVRVKDKHFQTNSYTEIARSMVYAWVNSKGHFKNIVSPDYQVTGLAISVDPVLNRIYAVQKFAYVLYTYNFTENTTFFPYTNTEQGVLLAKQNEPKTKVSYPFDLRDDDTLLCETCRATWEDEPNMSVRVERNYFILRVENASFVQDLIQHRKDGFAIEIVSFDPFACGNPAYTDEPSRRNKMKRTSGQLLKPVYRNDLLKGFRKRHKITGMNFVKYIFTRDSISFFRRFGRYKVNNFEAKYFEMKLAKVPKDLKGWWNHNLVYIKENQLCHFVYLTNYPGELVLDLMEVAYYPPKPVNNYEFNLERFSDTLELFYQAGQTVASNKELTKLIQRLKNNHLTVTQLEIEGFCSVDGDSLTNERLHQERALNIKNDLLNLTTKNTQYRMGSKVAWDHFYATVAKDAKWKFLSNYTKTEVKHYLNNPKNEKPLQILSQERKVKVVVKSIKLLSPENALYYVKRDMDNLFYEDLRTRVLRCRDLEKLEFLYEKAYYLSTVDTLTKKEFLGIEIPKYVGMRPHSLEEDKAFYRYNYLKDSLPAGKLVSIEKQAEKAFEECGAAEHLSAEFHYLTACLLVENIKRNGGKLMEKDENITKAFARLNLLLDSYTLDSVFYLNVARANLNIIAVLCKNISPSKIYEYSDIVNISLIHIIEYYRNTNQLTPEKVVELAKLACYFEGYGLAIQLCRDFLYDNEVLKIYLPLAYIHSSYLSTLSVLNFEQEFHSLLLEAKNRLSAKEWCDLFFGEYGIPFQVMDNATLHTVFCETCPNRVEDLFKRK